MLLTYIYWAPRKNPQKPGAELVVFAPDRCQCRYVSLDRETDNNELKAVIQLLYLLSRMSIVPRMNYESFLTYLPKC